MTSTPDQQPEPRPGQQPDLRPGAVTVLMSVYRNTTAEQLEHALDSIEAQTHPPERVLVVRDGPERGTSISFLLLWTP